MSLHLRLFTVLATVGTALAFGVPAYAAQPGTVQVTGSRLASALVPASGFGGGYKEFKPIDTGKHLERGPAAQHLNSMSCSLFWAFFDLSGYGETAWASDIADSSSGGQSYEQAVYQFATSRAAGGFYGQEQAKFRSCRSFSESGRGSSIHVRLRSLSAAHVSGHMAFLAAWAETFSGLPGTLVEYTLVTIDGRDLFMIHADDFMNTLPSNPSPATVTIKLIARVSALH